MSAPDLDPTPSVAIGAGTAVLLAGTAPRGALGAGAGVEAGPISRPLDGVHRIAGGDRDRWWSLAPLNGTAAPGRHPVILQTRHGAAPAGEIELTAGLPAPPEVQPISPPPPIAICMATYEPHADQVARQIESIRAQSREDWVCLISDDASSPESVAGIEAAIAGDPRFRLSRSQRRLGFYGNFERALTMVPSGTALVALSDQDDRWHPDKLESLAGVLERSPDAPLAYSDMRVVDPAGRLISDTFWYASRNAYESIATLAIINTVTGAASMFRRDLLGLALPFPPRFSAEHYHDHWLALCACATGEIAYLDRPTWDYTRHPESVTMRATSGWSGPPSGPLSRFGEGLARTRRRLRKAASAGAWETAYFERNLLIRQLAIVLELRAGERIEPGKRAALRRLAEAESDPAGALSLAARSLRPPIGRTETLGRERVLLGSIAWRRLRTRRP